MPAEPLTAAVDAKTSCQGIGDDGQQYANDQWVAAHMTADQAAASALECFRRSVAAELKLLELECLEKSKP